MPQFNFELTLTWLITLDADDEDSAKAMIQQIYAEDHNLEVDLEEIKRLPDGQEHTE